MTDLPPGWEWTTLGEVADSVKNGIFVSRPGAEPNGVPILRISAVRSLSLDIDDLRYTAMSVEEIAAQGALLSPGELLFTRYSGTSDYVGVCAVVPAGLGPLTYPDKLIRVQLPQHLVDPRFVALAFASPVVRHRVKAVLRTTAGQVGISGGALKEVPIPLPPLAEQRRIANALDDHLSRIDAGLQLLKEIAPDLQALRRSTLTELVENAVTISPVTRPLGQLAATSLGKMLDSKRQTGIVTPYLRNINIRWGKIELSDISTVPLNADEQAKFNLLQGDLLVCEGGEPGRCAIWQENISPMSFQKALHRVRPGAEVTAEWLAISIEEAALNGKMKHLQTGSTIKHLPQEKLRSIEIHVPPMHVQRQLADRADAARSAAERLETEVAHAYAKAVKLRQSLLIEALTGLLVPQDPDDEPASALLERITAEHAAQRKTKRTRKIEPAQETLL